MNIIHSSPVILLPRRDDGRNLIYNPKYNLHPTLVHTMDMVLQTNGSFLTD